MEHSIEIRMAMSLRAMKYASKNYNKRIFDISYSDYIQYEAIKEEYSKERCLYLNLYRLLHNKCLSQEELDKLIEQE